MHPWFTELHSYIRKQIPDLQNSKQVSLIFLEKCVQKYKLSLFDLCQKLSFCRFCTVKDVQTFKNEISVIDLFNSKVTREELEACKDQIRSTDAENLDQQISTNKNITKSDTHTTLDSKKVVLIVKLVCDVKSNEGNILIKDGTGEILCVSKYFSLDLLNSMVFLTKWNHIESSKISANNTTVSIPESFVELTELVFISHLKMISSVTPDANVILEKTKYFDIDGITLRKSPIHKQHGCTPFYFVQILTGPTKVKKDIKNIVIQGKKSMHWHSCMNIYHKVRVSHVRETKMKNDETGTSSRFLCASDFSDLVQEGERSVKSFNKRNDGIVNYNVSSIVLLNFGSHLLKSRFIRFIESPLKMMKNAFYFTLTLNVPCISDSCIEIKIKLNFYFTLLCGASKGFTKALKAFIKHFAAPKRSLKIKI